MKKITTFLMLFSLLVLNSCDSTEEKNTINFATFEAEEINFGVELGGTASRDIAVYTTKTSSSDRVLTFTVDQANSTADPASYTIPPSVTIPAGSKEGIFTIGLIDLDLSEDKVVVLELEDTDGLYLGEKLTLNLSQLCPNNGVKVKMSLGFDNWPEEVAWRILDATGATVMASADPFAYGGHASEPDGSTLNLAPTCLASGSYTLQIYDGYGDGGTSYSISANGIEVVSVGASDYTTGTAISFSI